MVKGLDTNVLVRYLVGDDKSQSEKAFSYIRKTIDESGTCFINCIVLCELAWVLESAYGYSKREISTVLEKMLLIKQFEIEWKDIVRQAIHEFSRGHGDFADYIIGGMNYTRGCAITATFDRSLRESKHFELIS